MCTVLGEGHDPYNPPPPRTAPALGRLAQRIVTILLKESIEIYLNFLKVFFCRACRVYLIFISRFLLILCSTSQALSFDIHIEGVVKKKCNSLNEKIEIKIGCHRQTNTHDNLITPRRFCALKTCSDHLGTPPKDTTYQWRQLQSGNLISVFGILWW